MREIHFKVGHLIVFLRNEMTAMIKEIQHLPNSSILKADDYDYTDVFKSAVEGGTASLDTVELGKLFFKAVPPWVGVLFSLRNRLVKVLGLKTGDGEGNIEDIIQNFKGEVGDRLGIFKVYHRTMHEIILGEDDKHLDFRTSLLLDKSSDKHALYISTAVKFHNTTGKMYFFIVKPFHKFIVKSMMKRMIYSLNAGDL